MKNSTYTRMKLSIFEKNAAGEITESQKDELLTLLEEKKCETTLSKDKIEDFFDELKDMYPDCKDDIKKLSKKILSSSDESSDEKDDKEEDESNEEEVSEAALEIFEMINNL